MNNVTEKTFSVIGFGRFGKLWATHLSRVNRIYIHTRNMETELINNDNFYFVPLKKALQSDFIFLTIPINQMESFLKNYGNMIKPGAVLIDCASVKVKLIDWAMRYLHNGVEYIATHPLFGPDSAAQSLKNHKIVVIPVRVSYGNLNLFKQILTRQFRLHVLRMSAEEHDRMMAYNLSLVHLIGRSLHNMKIENLSLKMNNLDGLLKISTIAGNDTEELFIDMNKFNPYAEEVRNKFFNHLQQLLKYL
ncbi:MAG: prephenate dehydrogenase/arogenate dehydrogenase family protein [Calditrichia bacterium]